MAEISLPIRVNLPDDWIDLVVERLKQDGTVQPVMHSSWQEIDGIWFCPECDEEYPQWYGEPSWRFCPMCGARMDGG
jgi:rubrerythrin